MISDANGLVANGGSECTDGDRAGTVGNVYLVGAGPGDPGLLTLRGVECLRRADVVLYDYLANPDLVRHAPAHAKLLRLGHHSAGRNLTPDQITDLMVRSALAGQTVVRLKGGDPSIFARGADEAGALRQAGIPFEIVPGITSGLAVAALAEIPLTHHDDASAVALVTGRERANKEEAHLDYQALADFPGTLVFYMGVQSAGRWSRALMEHGRASDTPVAVVRWCGRAGQQTVRCTLETVADVAASLRPPAIFVVGKVVARTPCLSWFESRPLFGTTVLVSGSARTAERLRQRLCERGAEVIAQPVIRIADPPDWSAVDATLRRLDRYDWLVFASPNAVERLLRRILEHGGDARSLAGVRIAALGAGTAERLAHYHIKADAAPEAYHPALVARALVQEQTRPRFLLARAHGDRPSLAGALEAAGARVEQVEIYATEEVDAPDPDVARALEEGEVGWVAVTSAATARALMRLHGQNLGSTRIASISPLTSAALRELGREPDAEAEPATVDGLVQAIADATGQEAIKAAAGHALAGRAAGSGDGAAESETLTLVSRDSP
ncbi:MAG: uroporphyrinogen-III C-methyltransferase [Gemmatimonadota bacterium]|jgi:uroporphyrinogen III methyltransferase / synthase